MPVLAHRRFVGARSLRSRPEPPSWSSAATPASAADPCAVGSNPVVCENSQARHRPRRVGHRRRRRRRHPGVRHRHLGERRAARSTSRSRRTPATTRSTSTGPAGTAGTRRAEDHLGRRQPRSRRPSPVHLRRRRPSSTTAATGRSRPAGPCRPTAVSGVYVAKLTDPATDDASHITFIVRNDAQHVGRACSRRPTRRGRRTTPTAARTSTRARAIGRAYKISYNRPFATRDGAGGRDFYFSSEFADGALPRAQRLRRQLHGRASTPTVAAR